MKTLIRPKYVAVVLCLSLLSATVAGTVALRIAQARLAERLDQSLILTQRAIAAEIDRFRYLPQVAGHDIRISRVVTAPDTPATIDAANRYLETIAAESGASQLYLLDQSGTTIASSNWNEAGSFVGYDYSFRPYFGDAMQTGLGRFYAIGVTTGRPGYFMSTRIDLPDGHRAVMVVKVELLELQQAWRSTNALTALVDADGIVFLSGQADWLYKPLYKLPAPALERIQTTRRYDGISLTADNALLGSGQPDLSAPGPLRLGDDRRLVRSLPLPQDGWMILLAGTLTNTLTLAWSVAAFSALATVAAFLLGQTLIQRRRLIGMRLRQGRLLEAQVERRTRELAQEVDIRIAAEAELRNTQEALIHAEKMAALGRMSTAIAHEISQPLAAMEATLAAAALRAHHSDEGTSTRIETARKHIRRMLRTIKHLKSFGRRESGSLSRIRIDAPVENAIDLVRHRAQGMGVEVVFFSPDGDAPDVMAGMVRLEQVFVNLLLNALDALLLENGKTRPGGQVQVSMISDSQHVQVAVTDNGSGISSDILDKIGEPFFSSKQSGDGLGLGLSICRTILGEFGGTMQITASDSGGTRVTVSLPRATMPSVAAA
ncbi:ATP-binding protein [Puniceibacterium sp. IMCC21224]|uniref:ATP-binding protein n=1 Tax=Puniceibacterium sp. IMCC21224 TaxID=1618204 RepID=UPI00064DA320|nr:ATP-binding protein [Puniceibacterium sp. IMCC21224]KMK67103.1 signal transduction histidine kinase regulating C4-dicarboxylate transport system [Puniceibacterium sp. IMCC21224]